MEIERENLKYSELTAYNVALDIVIDTEGVASYEVSVECYGGEVEYFEHDTEVEALETFKYFCD